MIATLRKYLIAGLLVWLPLAATIFIIKVVIDLLDKTILLLPVDYRPEYLFGITIPGFGLILGLLVLILTGMLAANLLGRRLVLIWEAVLNRIPLVRSIYNSVKQISTTLLMSDGKSFRKVVIVQYPRVGVWSMGFLTRETIDIDRGITGTPDMMAVFVPTTPNPTSGFIIMLPREDVREVNMTVEQGFKFIISMGVIVPETMIAATGHGDSVAQPATDS